MQHKIIICGGNGAGKSTLGKALADKTGWIFKDIEDYYFPKTDPDYLYSVQRTEEEVVSLLNEDLKHNDNIILASVRGNYSEETEKMFTCAVYINVPKEIRLQRIRQRSYDKFGERIFKDGDLYEREEAFFELVKKRSDKTVTDWLETMDIPIIEVDGTSSTDENAEIIYNILLGNNQR